MGKTVDLIRASHYEGGYIVVHNAAEANRVFREAERLGYTIRHPLTYVEILSKNHGRTAPCYHIDNADIFLEYACNGPVNNISISLTEDTREL